MALVTLKYLSSIGYNLVSLWFEASDKIVTNAAASKSSKGILSL